MKTPAQWTPWIIKYMQDNLVSSIDEAENQIALIVNLIQQDASVANSNVPNGAA